MLTIRLARVGKKNHAQYRIVVQEKKAAPIGRKVAQIGYYHPIEKQFSCDTEAVQKHLKNGAQLSGTMARLLVKNGFEAAAPFLPKPRMKKSKKAEEAAA